MTNNTASNVYPVTSVYGFVGVISNKSDRIDRTGRCYLTATLTYMHANPKAFNQGIQTRTLRVSGKLYEAAKAAFKNGETVRIRASYDIYQNVQYLKLVAILPAVADSEQKLAA